MAAIYPDFAIASVGMSCQAAHQILMQREAVDARVGATSVVATTPLDWMIAPPAAAAAMLRSGAYLPPPDALETAHGLQLRTDLGAIYWHERLALGSDEARAKYDHMAGTFARLLDRPALLVFTNLQTNLDAVARDFPFVDPVVSRTALAPLEAAAAMRPAAAVYYVLAEERVADPADWPAERTVFAPLGASEWKGDRTLWAAALGRFVDHFRATTPAAPARARA